MFTKNIKLKSGLKSQSFIYKEFIVINTKIPNEKKNMREEKYQILEKEDRNWIFNLRKNIKLITLE